MGWGLKQKLAIAVILGGLAATASFLDSAGQALSDTAPAMAIQFDPHNEIANQRQITRLLVQFDDKTVLARAAAMTKDTARTAPGLAPILRSFAMLTEMGQLKGDVPVLMEMASQFSKRDLPTQLWFIEQRAKSGDIEGTLAYYDNAMQTNPEVRKLLFPILGRAVADAELIGPIAQLLRTKPDWANGFYNSFTADPEALANFPALMVALGGDALTLIPSTARKAAATALMRAGALEKAETVAMFGMDATDLSDFSNGNGRALSPFGWELVRSATISAFVAEDNNLRIEIGRGAGGIAAKRVVGMKGGSLTIIGTMTTKGGAMDQLPRLNLNCVGQRGDSTIVLPQATGRNQYRFADTVRWPSCSFVEINIRAPGNFVDAPIEARITSLGLE